MSAPLQKLMALVLLSGFLLSCTGQVSPPSNLGEQALSSTYKSQCANGECPCFTPVGTIKHGSKVTIYDSDSVACADSCQGHASEALCTNGKLSVDVTKTFFNCSVAACRSCPIGINLIRHGESASLFSQSIVDCSQSCEDVKGQRQCEDGTLAGDKAFQYSTCQPKVCHCLLPDNSGYITLGAKMDFFSTNKATCGHKCAESLLSRNCTRTTSAGTDIFKIDGNASYKYTVCEEASRCSCPLPGSLGSLPDGGQIALSSTKQVKCGDTCKANYSLNAKCVNGDLLNMADNSVVNVATTPFVNLGSCTVTPCQGCKVNDTVSIPHDGTYNFYNTASPNCGSACTSLARTCKDGAFVGDSTFNQLSCTLRSCQCTLPDNPGVKVSFGKTQDFYSTPFPSCGKTCNDIKQSLTCAENKAADGSYSYDFTNPAKLTNTTCFPPTNCDCVLPGNLGKIQDKVSVTLSSVASVSCGETCSQKPNLQVTCQNGALRDSAGNVADVNSASFQYKYQCTNAVCANCNLPGYGAILNNAKITLYKKASLECGDNIDLLSAEFTCESSVLKMNGQPYATPATAATWFTSMANNCTGCPTPWGVTVSFGDKINFYKVSGTGNVQNACGKGCKVALRTCLKDGTFDGVASDFADFKLSACPNSCSQEGGGAPPRLCLLPWQNSFVTSDAQIPMWNKRVVGCGDSCQKHFKLGRCDMKTGTFDAGSDYLYPACSEVCN